MKPNVPTKKAPPISIGRCMTNVDIAISRRKSALSIDCIHICPILVGRFYMIAWQVSWLTDQHTQLPSHFLSRKKQWLFARRSSLQWRDRAGFSPDFPFKLTAYAIQHHSIRIQFFQLLYWLIEVSFFGNCVSISTPVSVTNTSSSIRTPPTPGK